MTRRTSKRRSSARRSSKRLRPNVTKTSVTACNVDGETFRFTKKAWERYLDLRCDGFADFDLNKSASVQRLRWGRGVLDIEAEVHKRCPSALTYWTLFNPSGLHR